MAKYEKAAIQLAREAGRGNGKNLSEPLISILMPVYNPLPEHLSEAIESVRNQIYPNWQLCIADDCSTDHRIRPLLAEIEKSDSRIKVVYREQNGHISAASNSALENCSGEYVALMDQDDLIPEHALWLVKEAIKREPKAVMIYSDEDKLDEYGKRYEPYFKPAWNPYLFRSQNMFSHLGVFAKALLQRVDGFREGFEGSQDYDLALRCIDALKEDEGIVHIPYVLYHWRVHPDSTAFSVDSKPYAMTAAERALQEHMDRCALKGAVAVQEPGAYKTDYALRGPDPKVVVVIDPGQNTSTLCKEAVWNLIEKTDYDHFEVWIRKGALSAGEVTEFRGRVREIPAVEGVFTDIQYKDVIHESHLSPIQYLCFVTSTAPADRDWLRSMVGILQAEKVGVVGGMLVNESGVVKNAGYLLGGPHLFAPRLMGERKTPTATVLTQELSAVSSECMVIKSDLFSEVGGFSTENIRMAAKDIDLSLKVAELGYKVVWTPNAKFVSSETSRELRKSRVFQSKRTEPELAYFQRRWGAYLVDAYLNPNCIPGYFKYKLDLDRPNRFFIVQ